MPARPSLQSLVADRRVSAETPARAARRIHGSHRSLVKDSELGIAIQPSSRAAVPIRRRRSRSPPACMSGCTRFFTTSGGYLLLAGLGRRTIPTRRTMPMDAPVEELGAPAEPLGPSGAPDLGSAIHLGQSQRAAAELGGCEQPNVPTTRGRTGIPNQTLGATRSLSLDRRYVRRYVCCPATRGGRRSGPPCFRTRPHNGELSASRSQSQRTSIVAMTSWLRPSCVSTHFSLAVT